MLKAIGVNSIDDLFAPIPAEYRLNRDLKVPRQMAESEIVDWFRERSRENGDGHSTFLGAGVYYHYRPVIIDSLISRGEFLTAYTPYQAEISQGTLQSIFEFQTMICELTGMEVANASMYDGSTAAAEAVMMAVRLSGRRNVAVARSVHPEYREVLSTYAFHQGMPLATVPFEDSGRVNLREIERAVTTDTACVLVQSPNFFGTIEDVEAVAEIAHRNGAMLVVAIAEAVSLGIIEPPRSADIIAMEAQSFGVPPGFGGPYCGVIATRESNVRQMPGRLVGQTTDRNGKRGFVLTLATREQHIRREKATSNITTNQTLLALAGLVYLSWLGPQGLREVGETCMALAEHAKERLGLPLLFSDRTTFKEFAVRVGRPAREVVLEALAEGIHPGYALGRDYPGMDDVLLVALTERRTVDDIERLAAVLSP